MLPLFQTLPRPQQPGPEHEQDRPTKKRRMAELPAGQLNSVSYVRVYANCRIRRVWFVSSPPLTPSSRLTPRSKAQEGERTLAAMGRAVQDEWALYAAGDAP
jgi:hypothetical protein